MTDVSDAAEGAPVADAMSRMRETLLRVTVDGVPYRIDGNGFPWRPRTDGVEGEQTANGYAVVAHLARMLAEECEISEARAAIGLEAVGDANDRDDLARQNRELVAALERAERIAGMGGLQGDAPPELVLCGAAHYGCDAWLEPVRVTLGMDPAPLVASGDLTEPVRYVSAQREAELVAALRELLEAGREQADAEAEFRLIDPSRGMPLNVCRDEVKAAEDRWGSAERRLEAAEATAEGLLEPRP